MGELIYLDHAATTPTDPEVVEAMLPWFTEHFGSASTLYSIGKESRQAVEDARAKLASLINAMPEEIYFTSGGTESDNWAVFGAAAAFESRGKHIITSKIEHHAILEPLHYLEKKKGYEVTYLPVDQYGLVDPEELKKAVRPDTIMITVMHANNEIGTIEPVEEIGAIAKEHKIYFHTDSVQTVGQIPVDVNAIRCDSLALSGHKLYGPKGIGAMYLRKGTRIQRFMQGGGQETNRRAGTHNVPGIVGLGKAAELAQARMAEIAARETELRDSLIKGLSEKIEDTHLNGHPSRRLPNNVNMSFTGIEGESMILLLDMQGICVSSGSACTSGSLDPSHVLMSLGMKHEDAHGSLRFTLGKDSKPEHISKVIEVLPGIVERLRMMSPIYAQKAQERILA